MQRKMASENRTADADGLKTWARQKFQRLQTENQRLREKLREVKKELTKLQDVPQQNNFVWKITDINDKISGFKTSESPFLTSGKFGYKLKLKIRFHESSTMSLYLVVCKGEYDDVLPWPFQQPVKIKILGGDSRKNYTLDIKPENRQEFQQPTSACNGAYGFNELLGTEELMSKYVKNGNLYIKVDVSEYSL